MDSEDGPNFSYAYGGSAATPPPSSWNPALRPDHDSHQVATKQLQPSPQIVPQSKPVLDSEQDEEEELPSIAAPSTAPAPAPPSAPARSPSSSSEPDSDSDDDDDDDDDEDEDESADDESVESSRDAPREPAPETNGHGDNGAEDEEALASAAQALSLGDRSPQHINGAPGLESTREAAPGAASAEEHPEENYEHQGESTVMEDAMAESDKAPLVEDAESQGDDWGASGEVFDLGGKPQDAPLDTPLGAAAQPSQAEAVGTTVGDKVIGNSTVGGNAGDEIDWGNTDDQDYFGNMSSNQPVELPSPESNSPGAHVVHNADAKTADSTWDIALDDDFLPDADDAPAPMFELSDDEGFLEDEQNQQPAQQTSSVSTASRYAPNLAQAPQQTPTPYGAPGSQFQNNASVTPNLARGAYGQPSAYQQPQPTRPSMPSSAQSFSDKAKGGYASPYDLPEDVVTTKRRPAARAPSFPTPQPKAPPPRSSSMYGTQNAAPSRPPPPSNMSAASLSPPSSSHSMQSQMAGMPNNAPKPPASSKTASSDFFAELPITSKPKPSGRYTPQQPVPQGPLTPQAPPQGFPQGPSQLPSKERTASWSSLRNEVFPDAANPPAQFQQPERLPVFPDQPSVPVRTNSLPVPSPGPAPAQPHAQGRYSPAPPSSVPAANSRYSPAPPSAPAATSRYSPAPPQAPQANAQNRHASEPFNSSSKGPTQPYAPRTSSPLAFHSMPQEQQASVSSPDQPLPHVSNHQAVQSAEGGSRLPFKSPLEGVSEVEEQGTARDSTARVGGRPETPPPPRSGPSSAVGSPRKRTNYTPQYQATQATPSTTMGPPPRAPSQSPNATMKQAPRSISSDRPVSGHGLVSPTSTFGVQPAVQSVANILPHRRTMSIEYEYIQPNDERVHDPLQRWKGYPIFKWGLGGTVVTSFPKQMPRYGGGAAAPMLKCSPGEIKVRSVKDTFPLSEEIAKFPGPLKGKSKKKDVSAWLGRCIEQLEERLKIPGQNQSMSSDDFKRLGEQALLWKVLQIMVDNDGHLEGNATAEAAVRKLLSPESASSNAINGVSYTNAADLTGGLSKTSTSTIPAEPIDSQAIEELRAHLGNGEREKAVWHAADQRLWAHAMLLSSTLSKDVWKQVVQEFVRKEVKRVGGNNQALATLYEIFAGNHEDCIDELVPVSARAGFQMMSTSNAGQTQNALEGLDKWQETLSLVLSNRSEGDASALLSLGRLLAGYGRVEAAHICFIFARSKTYISGVDDNQSDLVLIGANHRSNPLEVGVDPMPMLLTEVYEFALSLAAPSGSYLIPHLQSYKLAHAYQLAEYGHKSDAQSYCDAIAAAMKATTKISPYYNASFIAHLDDLTKRLSQSPKDGSSSWISKPSMDKVSSSLLSKFNSFIAGDDEDVASNHSGGADVGPFSKITGPGNTPTMSPSQSQPDLYGAYSGYGAPAAAPAVPTNSRYAPSNAYAPRASLEQSQPGDGAAPRAVSDPYMPSPQFSGPLTPLQSQFSPTSQTSKTQSYSPLRAGLNASQPGQGNPYQPTPPIDGPSPAFGGYQPSGPSFNEQPPSPPAEPQQQQSFGGYQPPSSSFDSRSHQPYSPPTEEKSPEQQPRKKKSFMDDDDDDDDLMARAAALKSKSSDADRQADEAFRKAAEADAKRDKEASSKKSGGWFGSWFKKDANAGPGPIKAKLGEENSFYYDPEQKKWVNKKAPASEASKPMATPPPPRSGPPSRAVSNTGSASGSMGPPSSLPNSSLLNAPPSRGPTSNPQQRSTSMPPPTSVPGSRASTPGVPSDNEGGAKPPVLMPPSSVASSGPPSRPGTGMSNASSIEDLIGAPQARKGGAAAKKKKGGRYVDVMAK